MDSMVMFHSYVNVYQRVYPIELPSSEQIRKSHIITKLWHFKQSYEAFHKWGFPKMLGL